MERAEATDRRDARDQPPSVPSVTLAALFLVFAEISLSSFGGAIAWAQRILVERRRWLTAREFAELLGLCQAVPGPSIVNLAIYLGTRHHGLPGAIAGSLGFLLPPLVVLLPLGLVYAHGAQLEVVRTALHGVAPAASGLLLATGIKMALPYRREPRALLFGALAFLSAGWLHWPLLPVLLVLAPCSIALAWRRAA